MPSKRPDKISVSVFKATCLAVLDGVKRTGRPVLITKRGQPLAEVVPPSPHAGGADWLGSMRDSARIRGDIVKPAVDDADWEALQS